MAFPKGVSRCKAVNENGRPCRKAAVQSPNPPLPDNRPEHLRNLCVSCLTFAQLREATQGDAA